MVQPLFANKGSSQSKTAKHGSSSSSTNASKRPRLSSSQGSNKENALVRPGKSTANKSLHQGPTGKDEKAMLDELMAGLDASVFDLSSPVASQRTPAKPSLELLGIKESKPRIPLSPTKRSPTKQRAPVRPKARILSPEKKPIVPKVEVKFEEPELIAPSQPVPRFDEASLKREVQNVDVEDEDIDEYDDELFEFDLNMADLAALDAETSTKSAQTIRYPISHPSVPKPPPEYAPTPWERCTVEAILHGLQFEDGVLPAGEIASDDSPSLGHGKTVITSATETGQRRIVHLKERWADLPLARGDIVNIVSTHLSSNTSPLVMTFKDPTSFIIHHPDIMITMTTIANAMPCPRKPILQSLVKVSAPMSKPMIYGTILHGLLQEALMEKDFSIDATRRRLDAELGKEERRLELWGAELGIEDVKLEVGAKAGLGFETFGRRWVGAAPKPEGDLHAQSGDKPSYLSINGLHEVEEDIWSPKWGLKGKVDASVQATIQRDAKMPTTEEHVAPLEIKTGRSVGVMAHRAQTMLYTLLMEDRYGVPVPAGLLYYSQLDAVLRVEARQNEIRALIMSRNELAHFLEKQRAAQVAGENEDQSFLPPTIDSARECKMCYSADACMLYRKAVDGVAPSEDDPIAELYEEKTGHLSDKDAAFFKKWESLLGVEERDITRFRSQLWTMTAAKRERTGRCFADMVISGYSNDLGKSLAKIHRHSYTFTRAISDTRAPLTQGGGRRASLLSGHIAKGDPVMLSIEPDLLCLSRGFITELTPTTVTVAVTYVIDTEALLARASHRGHAMSNDKVLFRIDKDEMASGMLKMRANLASMFFENGNEHLRRLVVDHYKPRFDPLLLPEPSEIPASFNPDQTKAMEAVMTAKDYALILGMPGTGKTTTIAEIIKALVERGKTVLLASYTHSAVDTILSKLLNSDIELLRLGNIDKVHPDVAHLTLEARPSSNMAQLEARLMSPPVVAATCLSVDHPLFFRRKFDYCIIDEASQITLPTCLGPLRMAETFVLVGDHFQLPPIVRNPEAKRGGLDVSLFKLLSEARPEAVTDLSMQYRMNEDIMVLSNELIYDGRLKCGSDEVAQQALVLPDARCGGPCEEPCWIRDLMEERVKAVFVDTDQVPAVDSRVGDLVQNPTEATLVYQLATALVASGLKERDLAVITPYRQQIKLLTGLVGKSMPRVEILTADKSQGRDKECILISLVRSNETGFIGDLLKDWRRINVSFTRAKRKLVVFGSRRTMEADPLLKSFVELMSGKEWVYTLPPGAEKVHPAAPEEDVQVTDEKKAKGKGRADVGEMLKSKAFTKELLEECA